MGITYNIAASLFAGTTPLIADLLVNATHGSAISPFICGAVDHDVLGDRHLRRADDEDGS